MAIVLSVCLWRRSNRSARPEPLITKENLSIDVCAGIKHTNMVNEVHMGADKRNQTARVQHLGANCLREWEWRNALDPRVWVSTVSPSGQPVGIWEGAMPSGCRATNVRVDGPQVYLVPRPEARLEAVRDLYDCCLVRAPGEENAYAARGPGRCERSVSAELCSCFPIGLKYAPAVWLHERDERRVAQRVGGTAWMMHFWVYYHHPFHFSDKMLELHGLFTTRCDASNNAWVPRTIDTLVSLDFPLDRAHLTDYEEVVMRIVENGTAHAAARRQTALQLMTGPGTASGCYSHTTNANTEATRGMCAWLAGLQTAKGRALFKQMQCNQFPSDRCSTNTSVLHLDEAYWSPNYNRQVPPPLYLTRSTLRRSIEHGFEPTWWATHCSRGKVPRAQPRVSIMLRVEGGGLRRWLNQEAVLRAVAEETGAHSVTWIFPSIKTPAVDQFAMFCGFDILLTPHSSQMASLFVARPGASVIEIQGCRAKIEKTFIMTSRQVGLHHQILRGNADNANTNIFGSRIGPWRVWDHTVNIVELQQALRQAVRNLRDQGILAR